MTHRPSAFVNPAPSGIYIYAVFHKYIITYHSFQRNIITINKLASDNSSDNKVTIRKQDISIVTFGCAVMA